MEAWKKYQEENKERFLKEMMDLLRIPSVSAQSIHKPDMLKCAEAVKKSFLDAGADRAEVMPTEGHPVVYAEKIIDKNKPTVLVYGHYDVQPVEPLDLWKTPPFEPTIKDGKVYARGSADDKGQFFMHVKALEIMCKTNTLPTNIKFIIEGEEEIGSSSLGKFIHEHRDLLKADVILISDTHMISMQAPSISVGMRGLSYIEVEVTAASHDLHSGTYGGAVANPIVVLSKMIAACHDENNHVTIPGFYDDVLNVGDDEKKMYARAPYDTKEFLNETGALVEWGEKGYTTNERIGIRPTLEVNGIWGGYIGEGTKTVLPAQAHAKISARLVPNQNAKKMSQLLVKYFENAGPECVKVRAWEYQSGEPYMTPIDSKGYKAAEKAIETAFGIKPIPMRGGGSIPISTTLENELGVKIVFMGFGLNNDGLHSPNEKYNIENFYKGIETIPYFHKYFEEYCKL